MITNGKWCAVGTLFLLLGGCEDVVRPLATVTALVLSPESAVLDIGGSRRFEATAQFSDGTTMAAMVTYQMTGGTISSAGVYTAGQTPGTFRVIATQSGGTLADTAVVTVIAPVPPVPPPPSGSGKTFFTADAEEGSLSDWSLPWGVVQLNGTVTASSIRAKTGTRSYKYEVTNSGTATIAHDVRTMTDLPQLSMGSPHGKYLSGYYSFWAYIDSGYDTPNAWNLLLGWMTGVRGAPQPIGNIGIEYRSGVRQLMFQSKNAAVGLYPAPNIAGYTMGANGWYYMSTSSPAGIRPFPRDQWVHVVVYYKMAPSNGQVIIWQDGVKIMDLTAPAMNTFGGSNKLSNTAGDMLLQFGIYGGHQAGTQRLYMDDFKVTDSWPVP